MNSKIVIAGHWQSGSFAQNYIKSHENEIDALVLISLAVARSDTVFPVPVLSVSGTLDGQFRISRLAEAYYFQKGKSEYPVVAIHSLANEKK